MNIIKSDVAQKKLYVRYMLSLRCKKIVREELEKLEIKHIILPYAGIEFPEGIEQEKINTLRRSLRRSGLDLLDLHESKLLDKIISTITEVIYDFDDLPKLTYTEIISRNIIGANESVMKIFIEVVGMSIIQFIVFHKVDRIKAHLLYDNFSLSEISKKLNYKSEQHLVAQFKKITDLTPVHFKKLADERNKIIMQSMHKSGESKPNKRKPVV